MKKNRFDWVRSLAILVVLAAIVYFYINILAPKKIPTFMRLGIPRKPFNLVILGTDITYSAETGKPLANSRGRTDTIILTHVDPLNTSINLLSIPRDTLAKIPGYGKMKINTANTFDDVNLVEKTIENLTSIEVHYYLEIKPATITKLIDKLGGVVLYIEKDMQYSDQAQGLEIDLKKGWQRLSGRQAHDYIRYRHDFQGDIGRVSRQQVFLKSLSQALSKPSNILKSPLAIKTALEEIETNLPASSAIKTLNFARLAKIKTRTLSGEVKLLSGYGSVWLPDKEANQQILSELF